MCRLYVGKRPQDQMMLVAFLARRGRIQEALAAMDPNWADCDSLAVARALEDIVKNATSIRAQNEKIEKIIQGALKKFGRPTPLLLVLANFTTQQRRYAEAEACYREVLKTEPHNGPALNNFAMLLALQATRLDER